MNFKVGVILIFCTLFTMALLLPSVLERLEITGAYNFLIGLLTFMLTNEIFLFLILLLVFIIALLKLSNIEFRTGNWALFAFFLIEIELIVGMGILTNMYGGYLPGTHSFQISNVFFDVEIFNEFGRIITVENENIIFDFNITNSEDRRIDVKFSYSITHPIRSDPQSKQTKISPSKSKSKSIKLAFKNTGINKVEFYVEITDPKTEKIIGSDMIKFRVDVLSEEESRERFYKWFYGAILLLGIIPSTVIAIKNLRDLWRDD